MHFKSKPYLCPCLYTLLKPHYLAIDSYMYIYSLLIQIDLCLTSHVFVTIPLSELLAWSFLVDMNGSPILALSHLGFDRVLNSLFQLFFLFLFVYRGGVLESSFCSYCKCFFKLELWPLLHSCSWYVPTAFTNEFYLYLHLATISN